MARKNGNKNTNGNGNGNSSRRGNGRQGARPRPKRSRRNGGGTMYGLSSPMAVRPFAAASDNTRLVQNQMFTHRGSDYITKVVCGPTTSPTSQIIATFPISPSRYPGTRLTQFSQLYEFFRFSSLRLRYVPAVPVSLACQLVLYIDLDPLDDPTNITNADALIRQAVAQTGAMQWNFHNPKNIPLAMRFDRQLYFTGDDKLNDRFSQQGRAYLIQITDPIDFNGLPLTNPIEAGSIFFDWTCEFCTPQLNPAAAIPLGASIAGAVEDRDYVLYVNEASADRWDPSWRPGGLPLLNPRSQYLLSPYWSSGIQPGNTILCNYQTNNETVDVQCFRHASNTGNYGCMVVETDEEGIPLVRFWWNETSTDGSDYGFYIRPLFYSDHPFALPPARGRMIDDNLRIREVDSSS